MALDFMRFNETSSSGAASSAPMSSAGATPNARRDTPEQKRDRPFKPSCAGKIVQVIKKGGESLPVTCGGD